MSAKSNKNLLWNNVLKKCVFIRKNYRVNIYSDGKLFARLYPSAMIQGEKHIFSIIQTFIATTFPKIINISLFFCTSIVTKHFNLNKPFFKSQHSTYNIGFCGKKCVGTHRSPLAFIMYF
jgi:hypothetical protein